MGASLYNHKVLDTDNTSFDSVSQTSGKTPSSVITSLQDRAGAIARWLRDLGGTQTVGGTSTALTLTLNETSFTGYGSNANQIPDGALLMIETASAATGAAAIVLTSNGALPSRSITHQGGTAIAAGDWIAGAFLLLRNDESASAWVIVNDRKAGSIYLPSAGKIDFNAGDVTITHSAASGGLLTFAGAAVGYIFDGTVAPTSAGGASLGNGTVPWSNAYINNGGKIDFNNGDVTVTHSTNALAFAGATSGYSFDNQIAVTGNVNASTPRLDFASMGSSSMSIRVTANGAGGTKGASFCASGGGEIGSISQTNTATAFNTSSDRRLKDNFRDFDSAALIDQLVVGTFEWKADGTVGYGVLAQDAYEVFPQMITPGEGDERWAADYSKLVPVLLREVQSLRSRMASIEGGTP